MCDKLSRKTLVSIYFRDFTTDQKSTYENKNEHNIVVLSWLPCSYALKYVTDLSCRILLNGNQIYRQFLRYTIVSFLLFFRL